jgi:hypothetical protein
MNLYPFKITDTWFHLSVHIIQQAYFTNKMIFIDQYGHFYNVHSYNKCKDMDHLFIICGAVYASCISRNPFKALSIHVNHNECVFLRTSSSVRVSCYQIVFYPAISTFAVQICYTNKILLYSYKTNKLFSLRINFPGTP